MSTMSMPAALGLMSLSTLIGAFGAVFLKRGAAGFSIHPARWLKQHNILIGASLYFLGIAVYIVLLRYLPLSIAYPLTSLSYIWILILSAKYLGEDVGFWPIVGVLLIMAGIVLVSL